MVPLPRKPSELEPTIGNMPMNLPNRKDRRQGNKKIERYDTLALPLRRQPHLPGQFKNQLTGDEKYPANHLFLRLPFDTR